MTITGLDPDKGTRLPTLQERIGSIVGEKLCCWRAWLVRFGRTAAVDAPLPSRSEVAVGGCRLESNKRFPKVCMRRSSAFGIGGGGAAVLLMGLLAAGDTFAQSDMTETPTVFHSKENADGSLTLWEGTLTAATYMSELNTCTGFRQDTSSGNLSPRSFSDGGNSWTIREYCHSPSRSLNIFFAAASTHIDDLVDANLEFHIGSTTFSDLSEDNAGGSSQFFIIDTGLNITAGTAYTLKFTRDTKPAAPPSLTAAAASTTQIDLSWSVPSKDGGTDIAGYRIEVSTDGGKTWSERVADTESTETAYSDTGLPSRATRHYRVSAINAVGTGPASSTASATTADDPAFFYAAENADGSLTLWEGTLTAATYTSELNTCTGFRQDTSSGSLSPRSFSDGGNSWTIREYCHSPSRSLNIFFAAASTHVDNLFDANLEFHIGSTIFSDLSEDNTGGSSQFFIIDTGLNITAGTAYTLKFTRDTKPSAPPSITAAATSATQIELSWSAPAKDGGSDVTGYRIEVSADGGKTWSELVADTESTDTAYSHTGLAAGTTRHYRISAINAVGTGPASRVASKTTAMEPPPFVSKENADGSLTLWEGTLTAATYTSELNTCTGFRQDTSSGSLSPRSFSDGGNSWTIREYCHSPSRSLNIFFAAASTHIDDLVDANLEFHIGSTTFSDLSEDNAGGSSQFFIIDTGLNITAGTAYTLKFTRDTKPAAPPSLTAAAASTTQIDLSWSAPSKDGGTDIAGYRIEVSTDGGKTWSERVADTESTETAYSDTGLPSRATRHYRVSAINAVGTGPASSTASATTADDPAFFYAAENADGSLTLWEGTLTAATYMSELNTCTGFRQDTSSGSLSPRSFSDGGNSWTIREYCHSPSRSLNIFFAAASTHIDDLVDANLEFHIGSTTFSDLSEDNAGGSSQFFIIDTGLNITAGTAYTLKFTRDTKPAAPPSLTAAAASTTQIDLSWSAPSKDGGTDIAGYRIEVSADGGKTWSELVADTESTETAYSDTGLPSRATRHYRVSAINAVGTGPASSTASATTADDPAFFYAAENADGSLTLWEGTLTAATYTSELNTCTGFRQDTSSGSLSPRSFSDGGNSWTIREYCHSPSRSLNIFFAAASTHVDNLFDANLEFHIGSTIFSDLSEDNTGGSSQFFIIDTGLNITAGTAYTLKFTRDTKPSAPPSITAAATSATQIELSWSAPAKDGGSDVTGYRIEVSADGGKTWSELVADTESTDTAYSHTGLAAGTTRHYRISAINAVGTGPASRVASKTTAMEPPPFVSKENADGSLTLWEGTLTAATYMSELNTCTGFRQDTSSGSLSPRSFSHDEDSWTIREYCHSPSRSLNIFFAAASTHIDDLVDANLEFHIGSTTFSDLSEDNAGGSSQFFIIDTGLNITAGTAYTLKFVRKTKPAAPRNLHAKGESTTRIDLSWRAPFKTGGSITGYKIEVSIDGGDSWSMLVANTNSTVTMFSHEGLSSGDTRYYRVSAINAVGTSPVSNEAFATAMATPPGLARAVVERTNSLRVRLEFDEPVETTSIPDKSAFSVDVEETPAEVTGFAIEDEGSGTGSLGWLDLAASVRPGETVTLSYAKPTTNPITDAANNEMAAFADYAVTNETSHAFPELSVPDEEVHESGNGMPGTMTFTVRADTEPEFPVGVHYETEDGTATGGASCTGTTPPDYVSTSGRLTLGPGASSQVVEVTICDDNVVDGGETFRLVLRSTQLHESIDELGEIGPEGKSYKNANGEGEETASATGTILNSESDAVVSIAADTTYGEEGSDAVFTLRRAGDAETELTVPVTVEETGAMLDGDAPESVTFAAESREVELRIATEDDGVDETDSTVTATVKAGATWHLAEDASSAELTVLDNDTAPVTSTTSADVTIWSADMEVVEYGTGSIGAGSADLFSNQGGSAGLAARWLWHDPAARNLKIAFDAGLDDAESMTLHVGEVSVAFPADSGGDSSFTIGGVDVSWTDGETLTARVSKPADEPVSTDATLKSLTVSGATLSPVFDAGTLLYAAAVDAATASATVSAESNEGDAAVAFAPSEDADAGQAGHQVAVPVGETLATVTVTAADGRTRRAYRVVVTRWPTVTVSFGSGSHTAVEGGAAATLTVVLGADPKREVTIPLTATPAGAAVAEDYTVDESVTFTSGGALSQTVEVTAVADDTAEEGESVVLGFGDLPDGVEAGTAASAAVTLADTAPEAVNTEPTGLPAIAGTPEVGATLTASVDGIEDGDGLDHATFAYQWLADDAAIDGATGTTYEVQPGDVGRTLTVRVTFTDDGGTAETLDSAATEAVVDNRPTVTSVAMAEPPDGGWTDSDTVEIAFGFSAAVTVATDGGTPSVALSLDGAARTAAYASGTGTASLTFSYALTTDDGTVSTAAVAADGLAPNGGTIRDADGRDANLAHDAAEAAAGAGDTEEASLTASFESVPATHDGSAGFAFRVAFSEDVGISYATMRDDAFEVDEGDVTVARRVDGRHDLWEITVKPDGQGDVTITLPGNRDCGTTGAVCTRGEDPRPLSNSPSATVAGPSVAVSPTASIAGGSGKEGDDDAIAFAVTLDRTAIGAVAVDYATSDGTADSDDYTAASGTLTFAPGDTEKTVSVAIGDDVVNEDDETFAVTLSNASGAALGTASATGTIENRHVEPLTASFEQVPAEHDGTTFVFDVRFSEDPAVSYLVLREESFDVTGGEVDKARRKDGRDDLREIQVQPSGHGDVTVSLPPTTDCDADGAICDADGRALSNANSAIVRAMPALSVADASATEGAGATLDFAVTLSRSASGPVTVAYATADGTAVAGFDYTAVSDTLSFAAGETSKTVRVALLDDSVDDDGETLTLTLSNPSGARLADATATGTIDNADPLPLAWLVRFGRTAADHAVDAVDARFESAGERAHATFAGRRRWGDAPVRDPLSGHGGRFGTEAGPGSGFGRGYGGNTGSPFGATRQPGGRGAQPGMAMNAGGMGAGMGKGMSAGAGMGMGAGTSAGMGTGMGSSGPPVTGGHRPALRDLLVGSSFLLSAAGSDDAGGDRRLTAWGRAAATRFDGADGDVRVDGDVATFLVGADAAWDRWLAGISVAHTIGSGGFSGGADEGALDSTLTAVHPYVRYQATDRLSAWGVLGYGAGSLRLETDDSAWRTDTSMRMAAAGLRGVLLSTDASLEVAARTDARFTHIGSGEAVGAAGLLGVTSGGTSRVRLLLEGTRPFAFGTTRLLTPSLQLGVRRDGGDAENGAGLDLGGSLRYADAGLGLSVEAAGRYLVAHEDSAYREWGASASVRVDPGIPGRGLTLSVVPSWGANATGGAERLWSARDARGLAGYGFHTDMRLQVQVGYGFSAFRGKGSMTPFAALSSSGPSGRELRAGALWTRGPALQMSLAGTRREAAGSLAAHGVEFRLTWRPGAREGHPGAAGLGLGMAPRVNAGDCLNADPDAPAVGADSSRNRKVGRGNGRPAAVDD